MNRDTVAEDEMSARTDDVLTVERPWGRFDQFATNETVTVKMIIVEAGHRLSLQEHALRAEMWIVVEGSADVRVDSESWPAVPGDMIWVPRGARHRLGNSGTSRLRILEIAFGEFDEGDIVRIDDYVR